MARELDKSLLNHHKEKHFTAAGVAEVAAGAISMGLGGYLAAKSEADHYMRELKREQEEIIAVPDTEAAEVAEILSEYGIQPHEYTPVVNALRKNPKAWLDFMMKFELGLEKPDPKRALHSALTIAIAYIVGHFTGNKPFRSALQTAFIGAVASAAAFGMAKAVQG
ncbi:UNVERIFIED_CONTAM: Vacuolar iron transporter 1 [Sesamum latifolium]|uniref:Vacuolar iron transporter n=1 Tax=Sesamum latifolium TaxID=2727402 RepID=A0AAW2WYL9_9LAMI